MTNQIGLKFLPIFLSFGITFDCHFFQIFIHFLSGLTLNCQFFKFSFFNLDLPLIASSSNFHSFFHLDLSSITSSFHLFYFIFLPGLTSKCQFDCALTLSHMFTWLDLHLWCQPCWDSSKTLICLNYLLPSEGLSEAFIGCKIPFFCVPISDKKTYIWCNVWLCMNEMSEHLNSLFC